MTSKNHTAYEMNSEALDAALDSIPRWAEEARWSNTAKHSAEIDRLDAAAREGAPERPSIDCGSTAANWCNAPWGDVCKLHTRDGDPRAHVWPSSTRPDSPRVGEAGR